MQSTHTPKCALARDIVRLVETHLMKSGPVERLLSWTATVQCPWLERCGGLPALVANAAQ